MDLRIAISNSIVKEILGKVSKQDKRIFIQEAILYFNDEITRRNTRSVVYDPTQTEDHTQTEKTDEIKEYTEITEENIQKGTEITGIFDEFSFSLD